MLSDNPVSDERLNDWSHSFYGVGVWINVVAPHFSLTNGYKNYIGNNTTDFVRQAHGHGLKVLVPFWLRVQSNHTVEGHCESSATLNSSSPSI